MRSCGRTRTGSSAPFHENDYIWDRDPFAELTVPSLFSCRIERAQIFISERARGTCLWSYACCYFKGPISQSQIMGWMLPQPRLVGSADPSLRWDPPCPLLQSVYARHVLVRISPANLQFFISPVKQGAVSVRVRPPQDAAHILIAVKWRRNERLNGAGGGGVTTCPEPLYRSFLSEPFISAMEWLKEQIHLCIPSNTEYQILNWIIAFLMRQNWFAIRFVLVIHLNTWWGNENVQNVQKMYLIYF